MNSILKGKYKTIAQHYKEMWDVYSGDMKDEILSKMFYNNNDLYIEMMYLGLCKKPFVDTFEEGYERTDEADIPEDVIISVVWGNGFTSWEYGKAKWAHGKWWIYSCEIHWGNGKECAAPVFVKVKEQ